MDAVQYDRWKDFALRMARTCYRKSRRPSSAWILECVEEFFDELSDADIPCIQDWDNSTPYPEGSPCYRKTYRCPCWHCSKPGADPQQCRYGCEDGRIYDYARPYCVADRISEFLDGYRGYAPRCPVCANHDYDGECTCEDIEDRFYDQWDDQWGGPVCCCIRAGLDCASAPSAGVVGFTAGDVRRMYPEGVPEWVFPPDERLQYWLTDELNGTFAELPDDAQVVL